MARSSDVVAVGFGSAYAGVMLAIGLGLGGYWWSVAPRVWATQFEGAFPFLVPCIGLTLTPAFLAAAASWRRAEVGTARRTLWRNCLAALALSVAITVAYHVPANLRIWSGELGAAALRAELGWWLALHALRLAAAVGAVVLAARTWSTLGSATRTSG